MSRAVTRKEPVLRSVEPGLKSGDPILRQGEPALKDVVVTTTPSLEGRPISAYLGIVSGEVILGADLVREPSSGLLSRLRGRSGSAGTSLAEARESALREMRNWAAARGANAVVGVSLGHQVVNNMLMVSVIGTAVRLGPDSPS